MSTQPITIEEVDLRALPEADIAATNAFGNVLLAESSPEDPSEPLDLTRKALENRPRFYVERTFWIRDPDGSIAAAGASTVTRLPANQHISWAGIQVRPDRRNRGFAHALLPRVLDAAEAEGRTLFIFHTGSQVPAGEAFAEKIGAQRGRENHTNRLLLAELDRGLVRRWIEDAPARAPGYSLVAIDGRYPDDLIEDIAQAHAIMNTAPRDELQIEDWTPDVEELREWERAELATGAQRWSLFVRHEESGELVGYTEVFWYPDRPKVVGQGDTAVRPDHRGRALGKWLKAAMLERILRDRPQADQVRTGNADSNDAMLAINRQLGFEPWKANTTWQVEVETVRAYLASRT